MNDREMLLRIQRALVRARLAPNTAQYENRIDALHRELDGYLSSEALSYGVRCSGGCGEWETACTCESEKRLKVL